MSKSKDKNSITVFFGARLRELRGERTQGEFAAKLGIGSQQTYARYEAGRLPPVEVMWHIARQMGQSVDSLLSEEAILTPNESKPGSKRSASATTLDTMTDAELREVLFSEVARLRADLPSGVRAHCYAAIIDVAAELMRRGRGVPTPQSPDET